MSLYGGINNKERYISGMFGTSLDFNKTEQSMSNPSHHSKKIFMFYVIYEYNSHIEIDKLINKQQIGAYE